MVYIEVVVNSKDRRKLKRKFPYMVEVKRMFVKPYDYYYDRQTDMDQWCNEQFGKGNWGRDGAFWYVSIYKFKLSEHKNWFSLRWL
jgi:hypothetical protein